MLWLGIIFCHFFLVFCNDFSFCWLSRHFWCVATANVSSKQFLILIWNKNMNSCHRTPVLMFPINSLFIGFVSLISRCQDPIGCQLIKLEQTKLSNQVAEHLFVWLSQQLLRFCMWNVVKFVFSWKSKHMFALEYVFRYLFF